MSSAEKTGAVAVEAAGVSVEVGGRLLLDRVSLTVARGEVVALLGPNGAGKSTLLGCLSGDRKPSAGVVRIGGGSSSCALTDLDAWPLKELARTRTVVLQENQVAFPFTVEDVVRMGRMPWYRTPLEDEDDEAVEAALDEVELTAFRSRGYPGLSGGERGRASFARALAQRTGILLLDEPTAALDLGHQEDVLTTTRRLADGGAAVVVVLHDLGLAAAYADRCVLLSGGRVHGVGTPADVITAETISVVYGHPVVVVPDPHTGTPLVVPVRRSRA
jgi:iron complex transport system ATP-binding protein